MAMHHIMHSSVMTACMLPAAWCVPVIACLACLYSRLWLQLRSVSLCLEVIYVYLYIYTYLYIYIFFFLAWVEVKSNGNHVAHMKPATIQQHGDVLHIVAAAQHAVLQDADVIWQLS